MNEIQIFENNELGFIRTILIDDKPYFVGKDVASVLGYKRDSKAIADHVDEEDCLMIDGKTQSHFGIELGQRGGWLINESGMYSLIFSSKLPVARKFKRWVTSVVLPRLRKQGHFELGASDTVRNEAAVLIRIAEHRAVPRKEQLRLLNEATKMLTGQELDMTPDRTAIDDIKRELKIRFYNNEVGYTGPGSGFGGRVVEIMDDMKGNDEND